MAESYYDILGVDKAASPDEIKRAYRQKAKTYHPDVSEEEDAEEKFKKISEAYEVLKDPDKRMVYDNPRPQNPFGFGGMSGFGFDIDDFLNSNFAQGNSTQGYRAGRTARVRKTISLFDALVGVKLESKIKFPDTCTKCKGNGGIGQGNTCPYCSGAGRKISVNGNMTVTQVCPHCAGRGHSFATVCPECAGKGNVETVRTIECTLPPGFSGGSVEFPGKGGKGIGGAPDGALVLEVSVNLKPVDREALTEGELAVLSKYLS